MKSSVAILLIVFLVGIIVTLIMFFIQPGVSGIGARGGVPKQGIMISSDEGLNWEVLNNFRGEGVQSFVLGKSEPRQLFVGTVKNGFWIGDEKGEVWSRALSGARVYDIVEDPLAGTSGL